MCSHEILQTLARIDNFLSSKASSKADEWMTAFYSRKDMRCGHTLRDLYTNYIVSPDSETAIAFMKGAFDGNEAYRYMRLNSIVNNLDECVKPAFMWCTMASTPDAVLRETGTFWPTIDSLYGQRYDWKYDLWHIKLEIENCRPIYFVWKWTNANIIDVVFTGKNDLYNQYVPMDELLNLCTNEIQRS